MLRKISEGIALTPYFGIVLSPQSITAPWVQRELEMALSEEMQNGGVKVLPLLYQTCELPGFLLGKMYADFTSDEKFQESLEKILRRLAE